MDRLRNRNIRGILSLLVRSIAFLQYAAYRDRVGEPASDRKPASDGWDSGSNGLDGATSE